MIELILVLAVLITLSAVTFPSLSGMQAGPRQTAAVDSVRAIIAEGRARSMDQATSYRLAVSREGTKIRLAADGSDFASVAAGEHSSGGSRATEITIEHATVAVAAVDHNVPAPSPDSSGWTTIATFLPDGTCREDKVMIEVAGAKASPIRIYLRGVTGGSRVLPVGTTTGGGKQ